MSSHYCIDAILQENFQNYFAQSLLDHSTWHDLPIYCVQGLVMLYKFARSLNEK